MNQIYIVYFMAEHRAPDAMQRAQLVIEKKSRTLRSGAQKKKPSLQSATKTNAPSAAVIVSVCPAGTKNTPPASTCTPPLVAAHPETPRMTCSPASLCHAKMMALAGTY
jgi:hypothetical protein